MTGDKRPGQESANRRFPAATRLIEELMIRSETFRSACEDLELAERMLASVDSLPEAVRENRRFEAEEWVETLTDEIKSMLEHANVVPFSRARRKPESSDS